MIRKNKLHMTKVMFMVAVVRPIYDADGNCVFDGKIRCWPFLEAKLAVQDSPNRPAGTIEYKPITGNRENVQNMMIQWVMPAIMDKYAGLDAQSFNIRNVQIQWDNAGAHWGPNDALRGGLCTVYNTLGWTFHLICQPAYSPDLNICDILVNTVLQKLQWSYEG